MRLSVDCFLKLRDGIHQGKEEILCKVSRFSNDILNLLVSEGFLKCREYFLLNNKKYYKCSFRYYNGYNLLYNLKLVSKGGVRVYKSFEQIHRDYIRKNKIYIVSTSRGLFLSTKLISDNLKIGGEILCSL